MKRQRIATAMRVATVLMMASIALAAEDRWSLKSPSGISFSEFKGYEQWNMVASSMPVDESGCGTSKAPGCIKSILGNPVLIKAYQSGFPANGQAVPDGAAFAKIEWMKTRREKPYDVSMPGWLKSRSC